MHYWQFYDVESGGIRVLRFHGAMRLAAGEPDVTIEARPSRHFRDWTDRATVATYGALPFKLLSANISPAR